MRCSHKLYEKQAAAANACPICQQALISQLAAELYGDETSDDEKVGVKWLLELLIEADEYYAGHVVDCYRPTGVGCTCGYEFWQKRVQEVRALLAKLPLLKSSEQPDESPVTYTISPAMETWNPGSDLVERFTPGGVQP